MLQIIQVVKLRFLYVLMVLASLPGLSFGHWQTDVGQEVMEALKNQNAKQLSNNFSSNISLSIKNDSGYYSKFQAELMLSDFFRSSKSKEVKLVQQTNRSNSSFYIVYQLKTNSGTYRVFVKFNNVGGDVQITEMRIE